MDQRQQQARFRHSGLHELPLCLVLSEKLEPEHDLHHGAIIVPNLNPHIGEIADWLSGGISCQVAQRAHRLALHGLEVG